MKQIEAASSDFAALVRKRRSCIPGTDVQRAVSEILHAVEQGGDAALCELTAKFDGVEVTPDALRVALDELAPATDPEVSKALEQAIAHVRAFHEAQLRKTWECDTPSGGRVGEVYRPVRRAGLYVPAGTAPLLSTVIMTVVPAQVAGVEEICVVTPPKESGRINPGIAAACRACGVEEVYRVGGAQAIAALAFGTSAIAPVDVIAGPGNKYVTEAKRQVFGRVGIDLLAGPSESLVIIDNAADPAWVAADILSQAEHLDSATYVVSVPGMILDRVQTHIHALIAEKLPDKGLRKAVMERLTLIHCNSYEEAARVANLIGPEHLQIITERDDEMLAMIRNAGAVFLGPYAPVPLGDFVAGPSHVLPTGGASRFMSGLSTEAFTKRIGVIRFNDESFERVRATVATFGRTEELPAHEYTATVRGGKH
jgi:histidinol dehydrogenase